MTRRKLEPFGYEEVSVFCDRRYWRGSSDIATIRMPVYDIAPWCEDLRKYRIDRCLSLREAAMIIGIPPVELAGIEHGRLECSKDEAKLFMAGLWKFRMLA